MNDSRNIEDGASASLCAYIRIFTTTTSNKQYFLNEKAVRQKRKKSHILFAISNKVSIFAP